MSTRCRVSQARSAHVKAVCRLMKIEAPWIQKAEAKNAVD